MKISRCGLVCLELLIPKLHSTSYPFLQLRYTNIDQFIEQTSSLLTMTDYNAHPSSGELRRGLESLPQELYDQIYKDVFTASPKVRHVGTITTFGRIKFATEDLNPLHISQATRSLYAKTFYGHDAGFEVHLRKTWSEDVLKWLSILPHSHIRLLRKFVIAIDSMEYDDELFRRYLARNLRARVAVATSHNCGDSSYLLVRLNGTLQIFDWYDIPHRAC